MSQRAIRLYALLGPGILFAASAIGVSHLVQSTRAGAMYGLAMIPILLVACAAKYPSLLFGLYPAHTGRTLLHSYREAVYRYSSPTLGWSFSPCGSRLPPLP